jgi:copper homeostasis protein
MNHDAKPTRTALLEVIVCTVEDALEAERGGADRLEVVRDLGSGGLTPAIDLVRRIQDAVDLPLRVMLREAEGYGLNEVISVERLCCLANAFNKMGVDGVVLGFLRRGAIDVRMTRKVLACAPSLGATFHHAFEEADDKIAAIEGLKGIPQIDRILAHGGDGGWTGKAARLELYARAAGPEIAILAGGGVDPEFATRLLRETSVKEFHAGRAARENGVVQAARVATLVESIRGTAEWTGAEQMTPPLQ